MYYTLNEFLMKGTFLNMPFPPSSSLQNFTLKIKTNGWSGFGFLFWEIFCNIILGNFIYQIFTNIFPIWVTF